MQSDNPYDIRTIRFNYLANVLDGGFFEFALGFASFSTVIPLFVSTMTDSGILIGLIPAIHAVGWQLPQHFTAQRVARLPLLKPLTLLMTVHERIPFLGLAATAWFLPQLGPKLGVQAGAISAGYILENLDSPYDYTICFLAAVTLMVASWFFINLTREKPRPGLVVDQGLSSFWGQVGVILRRDRLFRWFLVTRMVSQFALMAFSFYTVYAVRQHGMSESTAGLMTSVWLITQVVANPLLGWLANRWSHHRVLEIGAFAAALSAFLAWLAPHINWFFVVNFLAGIASTVFWTIGLAITLKFGAEQERPAYIGLANTLIAPFTILAPVVGGWLADNLGYPSTFLFASIAGLVTTLIFQFLFIEPNQDISSTPRSFEWNSKDVS